MSEGVSPQRPLSELPDESNTLVLSPATDELEGNPGLGILSQFPPAETHVLAITYTAEAEEWVDVWEEQVGRAPASGGVVAVGQSETDLESDTWTANTVESPADLTGIGIESSELLSTLAGGAGTDEPVVVVFDSVSALLEHADLQRAFRFLHVVTGRVRSADARCYYHLDPAGHEQQVLATLESLFETTVEYGESRPAQH